MEPERRAQMVRELAARMCRAQSPAQALVDAAHACAEQLPSVMFVGLTVAAADQQTVRYTALLSSRAGAPRLGAVAADSAAASIAAATKQPVAVRDLDAGDLGFEDLQYLRAEHGARSFLALPLVLARAAVGSLALASSAPHAFGGHEPWLQMVAALCAPYLALVKSHQELVTMEGLVTHIMPSRVALQLREEAAQLHAARGAAWAAPSSQPPTPRSLGSGSLSGESEEPLPGPRRPPPAEPPQRQWRPGEAAGGGRSAAAEPRQPPPTLAAEEPQPAGPRQQQHHPHHKRRQGGAAEGAPPLALQQKQLQQQQQPPQRQQPGPAIRPWLAFAQPQLEQAYRASACRQWQQWLDGVFVLLSLLSASGGWLARGLTGSALVDGLAALVALATLLGLLQRAHAQPVALYLRWRQPCVGGLRLLRAALLCRDARRLPAPAFARPAGGGPLALLGWSPAELAGCGVLLMQGLTGQLPLPLHAAVQLACVAAVAAALAAPAPQRGGGCAGPPLHAAAVQLLLAWVLPVLAVAAVEWHARRSFLHRIR